MHADINLHLRIDNDFIHLAFYDQNSESKNIICKVKDGTLHQYLYSNQEIYDLSDENIEVDPHATNEISLKEFIQRIIRRIKHEKP